MRVVGLMSGTSADGIDAAVVEIFSAPPALDWKLIYHHHEAFDPSLRTEILACTRLESSSVDRLCALNFRLGEAYAAAAQRAIQLAGLEPARVDLIGSHGQTVWHAPGKATLQLGEAAVIAERTGIATVSDFRARDMAAGGQGAPLVAYVDALLLALPTLTRAAQNIGGIANVTFLPRAGTSTAFAFDTGPGNMLIDDMTFRATNGEWSYDKDGLHAQRGKVDEALLAELMEHPYLKMSPPKTTGREVFGQAFGDTVWQHSQARGLGAADLVATVTAFTAHSIAQAYRDFLPRFPDEVILSGGGAQNQALGAMLREQLAPARILLSDHVGIPSQAKEAIAFAVLAYESYHGRPGNLPAATGASTHVVLGNITPGKLTLPAGNAESLTEGRNPATENIDTLPTIQVLERLNGQDAQVSTAIEAELPAIARAVDAIAERMRVGGRLVYVGAGTSGRLGVLDAAEIPPTFGTDPDRVIALIAGGERAIRHSTEGAEDDARAGTRDVANLQLTERDALVGIAASGRTPYVLGGMEEAKRNGALVISLACNRGTPMQELADISIAPLVGPEAITGSTRLKAGTAQKLVLNMLSTAVMIRLGKTYGNLMVDVQATNTKLRDRARRIVEIACDVDADTATALLTRCRGDVKVAIVSALTGVSPDQARQRLQQANGVVRAALG